MSDYWYYLDETGDSKGPLSTKDLSAAIQSGAVPKSTRVNKAGSSDWIPAESVAPVVSATSNVAVPPSPPFKTVAIALGGMVAVLLFAVGVLLFRLSSSVPSPAAQAPVQPTVEPKPKAKRRKPAPPPKTKLQALREIETFDGAVAATKSEMGDTRNDFSAGALQLTAWGISKMKWEDVHVTANEATVGAVMKDSEEQFGKRICAPVSIIEIAAQKEDVGKYYIGTLWTGARNVIRFLAVGSTGDLVAKDQTRFCGVVTGQVSYANSGGGTTHAIALVGMFDLPENK